MLTFNKLFLALAFLGGSAAAQAGDGTTDAARTDHGKNSEKTDRINGTRRSLSTGSSVGSWSQNMTQQHVDSRYGASVESLSGTHNGVTVAKENLLGRYDVTLPLASTARLFDGTGPTRSQPFQASLSLSESQNTYLPVHHLL